MTSFFVFIFERKLSQTAETIRDVSVYSSASNEPVHSENIFVPRALNERRHKDLTEFKSHVMSKYMPVSQRIAMVL